MRAVFTALPALLIGSAAQAEAPRLSGYIGAEATYFTSEGLYPGQLEDFQGSFVFAPELRWRSDDRDTQIRFSGFARWDSEDSARTHWDVREAYIRRQMGDFSVLLGAKKVFWGVTESRHLVDVINQLDLLEYTDDDARLGQPMLELSLSKNWGTVSAFFMTGFRELEFPGVNGRLRAPLVVDEKAATYGHSSGGWAPDTALRYSNTFGSVDLGLSAFNGTSREPLLLPTAGGTALRPHYSRIWQTGIDVQWTGDAALWKLEVIRRGSEEFETFEAAVGGVEYTVYQIAGSDGDLGLIAEYLYDGRGTDAPVTAFQDDMFLGARWTANDSNDTSLLAGGFYDLEDGSTGFRAEFERRLDNGLVLKVTGQGFGHTDTANPLHALREDDFLSVALEKHF